MIQSLRNLLCGKATEQMNASAESKSASNRNEPEGTPPWNFIRDLYRRPARFYDWSANLYYMIGYREWAYRKWTVDALNLESGDTVVELGCATGLNFPLMMERIGETGRLIGVDLTDAMVRQARRRVRGHGWTNVESVKGDAVDQSLPAAVQGVLSSFALPPTSSLGLRSRGEAQRRSPGSRMSDGGTGSQNSFRVGPVSEATGMAHHTAVRGHMAARPIPSMGIPSAILRAPFGSVTYEECYAGFTYRITGYNNG